MTRIRLLRSNKISDADKSQHATITEKCSSSGCHIRDSEADDYVTCIDCKRNVHHKCSLLPAYFIQNIKTRSSDVKFICQSCTDVPKDLVEQISSLKETEALKRDIKNCENIIHSNREKEVMLEKKLKEKHEELKDLKKKLKAEPGLHTIEYLEQKFERKVEEFGKDIKTSIIEELKIFDKSYAEATKNKSPSTQIELKDIIKSAKEEQMIEDHQKKIRVKNLIIHGCQEEEGIESDRDLIENIIKDLKVKVNVKYITRLGKNQTGHRPIKVVLENENDKAKIMGNLSTLKDYPAYRKVSIMDDYTPTERQQIKIWSEKAKHKNEEEPEKEKFIWKVRGSPKNVLYLKKFQKKNQTTQQKKTQ